MDVETFLWTTITTDTGWFCLAYRSAETLKWEQEWYGWPDDIAQITKRIGELREGNDVYFSPYLFKERNSVKQNVLLTRTIVADLDDANILTLPKSPTVLVETSPERHQGYWVLREQAESLDKLEELAQRLTYSIPRCDRTGWFLGKMLRVPGTFNYKYVSGPKYVQIVSNGIESNNKLNILDLENLPPVPSSVITTEEDNDDWIDEAEALDIGPQELLATIGTKLPPRVVATYDLQSVDRSGALWGLMTNAFRAGCTKEQVYILARDSANNKFADLKYGSRKALGRDVLRAEQTVKNPKSNIRERIAEARKLKGTLIEKRIYITELILRELQRVGQFLHCVDNTLWYIRSDVGRPIFISPRSDQLNILLDIMFGINSTEPEASFIKSHLVAYASEIEPTSLQTTMSYYDSETHKLFIHTGGRDVLLVTKDELKTVINGHDGVLFNWDRNTKGLAPDRGHLKTQWYNEIFNDCLDNLIGLAKEDALAILRVWTIMIVMRNAIISRPILALLGQPGAGKSTLFRRVYTLLYGEQRSLNAITNADDFDFAIANDPLVVFDNVDTWERWLPDKLAISVTNSEMKRRKLYTDNDTVTIQRQAIIGLTAHSPKFGREDVADRLLIFNFERLQNFKSETEILDRIVSMRNYMWGEIVQDIQAVLKTPLPSHDEVPQFRVEDFARIGYWIAKATGCGQEFSNGIKSLRSEQQLFALDEDQLLVSALDEVLKRWDTEKQDEWRSPGQLWQILQTSSKDSLAFQKKYSGAAALGKKLWSLQEALKALYKIEWKFDSEKGSRVWRFMEKHKNGRV